MNNKGFTMVELLASMVLLSILMLVAVPTVLKMMDETRRKTIVNDAKKLVSSVEYKVKNNNNYIKKPRRAGQCIVVTLGYLDLGNEFKEGPHGGIYELDDSYVIVKYDPASDTPANPSDKIKKYKYYVTLVEKYENNTVYGIFLYPFDKLSGRSATGYVGGFNRNNLISPVISNGGINSKLKGSAFKITNPDAGEVSVSSICSSTTFTNQTGGAEDNIFDTQDALDEVNEHSANES